MLIALAGLAIPMAIHLRLRRRAPEVSLDAVMQLVLAGGGTVWRLKWIHGLLLGIRVLIVAAVVLVFAQPYLERPASGIGGSRPAAFALVLDDSLSMQLSAGGRTPWDRAKSAAMRALSELPPESEVHVILASRSVRAHPGSGRNWDATRATRFVAGLRATRAGTDLPGAMRRAAEHLRSSPIRDRRLAVISDFVDHATEALPSSEELAGIEVVPLDVSTPGPLGNRAILDVTAKPATDLGANHVRIRVEVLNDTEALMREVVGVRVGKSGVAREVECPPRDRCAHEFLLAVEEGILTGDVRIPLDALPDDDVRGFSLAPRSRNAVLLVNGSLGRSPEDDETFFLARALALRVGDDTGFVIATVRPEELSPLHLSAAGTVALVNVTTLAVEQVRALADFVAQGFGLLVSMGDSVDPDARNLPVWDLLPAPPRDVADRGAEGVFLGLADPDSPVTEGLLDGAGSVAVARVRRYVLLDDGWKEGSRVLASLSNDVPILVERRLGEGRVLAWLTTLDREWTDLPLRPAYAPFVRGLFGALKEAGSQRDGASIRVGEPRFIDVPEGFERVVVTGPAEEQTVLTETGDFMATDIPGVHRLDWYKAGRDSPVRSDAFVVNVDPRESLLRKTRGIPESWMAGSVIPGDGEAAPARKVPLMTYLIVACLCLLLAEAWLRGKS
jgi:hypothetical protein